MELFSFKKLEVYHISLDFVTVIYDLLKRFPESEKYGLVSQLRRAVVSIPSNIAEGTSRFSFKEKIRFIEIAYGSLMEVYCQLQIAYKLNFIQLEELKIISKTIYEISRKLNGLKHCYDQKSKQPSF